MGGRVQIGRTASKRGQFRCERIHDLAAGDAGGHALGIGGKNRDVRVPTRWQLTAQATLQFLRQLGKCLGIGVQPSIPIGLDLRATTQCLAKMRQCGRGHQKRRIDRPAKLFLGSFYILNAERRSVCLVAILLGRAKANMGTHQNQRWSRDVGAGGLQRGADRSHVVAIGHADSLPAIGFEAFGAIFRKCNVGAGR